MFDFFKNERDRHQEAMEDLRDNNLELQEQLQDAQDQLELLLAREGAANKQTTSKQPSSKEHRVHGSGNMVPVNQEAEMLNISKLLFASEAVFQKAIASFSLGMQSQLIQARQMIQQSQENSYLQLQQEKAELIKAHQLVSRLEQENAELRITVGRHRYQHHPGNPGFLPPSPVPPPPPVCLTQQESSLLSRRLEELKEKNDLLSLQLQRQGEDLSRTACKVKRVLS